MLSRSYRLKRAELRALVAEILEVDAAALNSEVELASLENYDSVMLLSLMIRLDEGAGIKMNPSDVLGLRTYGDIEQLAIRQGQALTE
jgi:acyl carrier protein